MPQNPNISSNLTVIGVGGCGKTLLKSICKHNWFLEYFISRPNHRLKLYTIDTATDEYNDDQTFMSDVRNRAEAMRENANVNVPGTVRCGHLDLTRLADIQEIPDLISPRVVRNLQTSNENVWWLHDQEAGINFRDLTAFDPRLIRGFGGGVYRMRAVSKAAFTIAYSRGCDQFADIVDGTAGEVAIIVGLGGGTGSGMFIDLAEKIREQSPNKEIYLFAVLPTSNEGFDEKLNAAVALTELEYLNTHPNNERGIFDHVILTTLEKTRFVNFEESQLSLDVLDFSDAFTYLFVNIFAISHDGTTLVGTNNYCGFIHADSHVIDYPIDTLRQFETKYDSYLNDLYNITTTRKFVCDSVNEFFESQREIYHSEYGDENPNQQNIGIGDITRYRENIIWVKNLWDSDNASILRLNTPEIINRILHECDLKDIDIDNLHFTELKDYVSRVSGHMKGLLGGNRFNSLEDRDKKLFRCIYDNLSILNTLGEYYTRTTSLTESLSRKAHLATMSIDNESVESQLVAIEDRITELSDNNTRIFRSIGNNNEQITVDEFICRYNNDSVNIDTYLYNKDQTIIDANGRIAEIKKNCDDCRNKINNDVNDLKQNITNYYNHEIRRKEWTSFEEKYIGNIENKYKKFLEMKGENINRIVDEKQAYVQFMTLPDDMYPETDDTNERELIKNLKNLDNDISSYYLWKYNDIVVNKRFYLKKTKDRCKNTREDFSKKIGNNCQKLKNTNNIDFNCNNDEDDNIPIISIDSSQSPIVSIFTKNSETIMNQILSELCNKYNIQNNRTDLKTAIENAEVDVESIIKSLNTAIYNALNTNLQWDFEIKKSEEMISKRKEEIKKEVSDKITSIINNKSKIKYLESVAELLSSTYEKRYEYTLYMQNLTEPMASGFSNSDIRRPFKSILGTPSPEILSTLQLDSTLDSLGGTEVGRRDINRVIGLLSGQYLDLLNYPMLGIRSLTITNNNFIDRMWNSLRCGFAISTQSDYLEQNLNLMNPETGVSLNGEMMREIDRSVHSLDPCTSVVHNGAKPWECGVTFMLAGNYLENIYGFEMGGGYRAAYDTGQNNILHHVLGLERGCYLVRDLLTVQDAMDKAYEELDGNNDIRNTIRELYHENTLIEAIANRTNPQGI